jgi:hypothetical protein
MKRTVFSLVIALSVFFVACNGGGKETAESIAKKWCDLNSKVAKASTPEAKEAAEQKRKEYENTIEAKYTTDTAMRDQVMKEVEKCEDASEGR